MRHVILLLLTLASGATLSDLASAQPTETPAPIEKPATASGSMESAPESTGPFLSMEQAIKNGLTQHPILDKSRYESLAAKAVTTQTVGELYPWIEASAAMGNGSIRIVTTDGKTIHDRGSRGFDPGGALAKHNQNMLTGGLLVNQLISDFGYTAHRILASRAAEAATQKEIQTHRAIVILNVQKAYLNCLLQQSLAHIAAETVKRRKVVRDQIETLYRRQLKSKVDLDLIKVEVSNAELALINATNELAQRFAELNNAMGIRGSASYQLEKVSVEVGSLPNPESLVEEGLTYRPELLGSKDRIKARDELVKSAKALAYGSVTGIAVYGTTRYFSTHESGMHDNQIAPFYGVGATLRYPIFTGFKVESQVKEAMFRKGEAEYELQSEANEVVLQVVRSYLTEKTNADQIELEKQRVAFAIEALQLSQERYRIGLSPIIEVVRATTARFEAESRLAEAQYIYKTSQAAVAFAVGREYRKYEY